MSGAYYNDNDPFICAWLKELIRERVIADGEVDSRPIQKVQGKDLKGFTQCHFFAGIGGWSLAARLAGIADSSRIWTCSCPCPPFSIAGKQKECPECTGKNFVPCPWRTGFFICCGCEHAWFADERHLLPEVHRLLREAGPDCPIFGEQVASEAGCLWFSVLRASLEILDYGAWGADLCSAGVGKDHIRQRIYWMAYANGSELERETGKRVIGKGRQKIGFECSSRIVDRLGEPNRNGFQKRSPSETGSRQGASTKSTGSHVGRVGNANREGLEGWGKRFDKHGNQRLTWPPSKPVLCSDGKWRNIPVNEKGKLEPLLFPLADVGSFRNRVGALRGAGNAIDPQLASEFMQAGLEALSLR